MKILSGQIEPDAGSVAAGSQGARCVPAAGAFGAATGIDPGGRSFQRPGRTWLESRIAAARPRWRKRARRRIRWSSAASWPSCTRSSATTRALRPPPRRGDPLRSGLSPVRIRPPRLRAVRRMEDAGRARLPAVAGSRAPAPRRAPQSPRCPTLEWFDAFLRRSRKALLLVSHDREFLDRQIDRVLSLEPEGLRSYAATTSGI